MPLGGGGGGDGGVMSGVGGVMTWLSEAGKLAGKGAKLYIASIVCVPTARAEVLKVALPLTRATGVPATPSMVKVTAPTDRPVGVLPVKVTVAVKVTC